MLKMENDYLRRWINGFFLVCLKYLYLRWEKVEIKI